MTHCPRLKQHDSLSSHFVKRAVGRCAAEESEWALRREAQRTMYIEYLNIEEERRMRKYSLKKKTTTPTRKLETERCRMKTVPSEQKELRLRRVGRICLLDYFLIVLDPLRM